VDLGFGADQPFALIEPAGSPILDRGTQPEPARQFGLGETGQGSADAGALRLRQQENLVESAASLETRYAPPRGNPAGSVA